MLETISPSSALSDFAQSAETDSRFRDNVQMRVVYISGLTREHTGKLFKLENRDELRNQIK